MKKTIKITSMLLFLFFIGVIPVFAAATKDTIEAVYFDTDPQNIYTTFVSDCPTTKADGIYTNPCGVNTRNNYTADDAVSFVYDSCINKFITFKDLEDSNLTSDIYAYKGTTIGKLCVDVYTNYLYGKITSDVTPVKNVELISYGNLILDTNDAAYNTLKTYCTKKYYDSWKAVQNVSNMTVYTPAPCGDYFKTVNDRGIVSQVSVAQDQMATTCKVAFGKITYDINIGDDPDDVYAKIKEEYNDSSFYPDNKTVKDITGTICVSFYKDALKTKVDTVVESLRTGVNLDPEAIDCSDFDVEGGNLIKQIYYTLVFVAPIMVIVLGSVDYGKAVLNADQDAIKKATKRFTTRLLALFILLLLPFLINIILKVATDVDLFYGTTPQICIR